MARDRARQAVSRSVIGGLLALAVTSCGSGGDDDGAGGALADREAESGTTTITADHTDPDSGDAQGTEGGDGEGTELEREQSDAGTDLERRVAETLTEFDTEVRDGDTVITLPEQVLFDFDQYVLLPEAADTLDGIAEAITYFEGAPVQVAGHTDSVGSPDYNQTLSERRAQSVVDYLVGAGVDVNRVTAQGLGETQPVAPNANDDGSDDPEGRAQNRRVEVIIEGVDPADVGA